MRPKLFEPEIHNGDERYVRDKTSGLVYHRTFNRVLYADTDRSGVVYHSNYLIYFEMGRAGLMRDVGFPYLQVEESGYIYPVVETGLRYVNPLTYDCPMWIHTRPSDLERVRVKFDYVITNGDTGVLVCTGFTTHCAINNRSVPVAVDPVTVKTWKNFPK